MTTPKNYVDIGHLNDSILWLWARGKIDTASSKNWRTHAKVWGDDLVMKSWRGRYEPETGRVSVSPPFSQRHKDAPQWLIDALEEEFGGGCEMTQFNPGKAARRAN